MRTVTGPWGTFRGWDGDIVSHVISTGFFWDQQIQPFLDEADPTGWALDLGANIGWFTVYLAKRFAHVLAVEAHPETAKLLQENIELHGVGEKVTCSIGAAYDRVSLLQIASVEQLGWPVPSDTNLDLTPNAASLAFIPNGSGRGLTVPAYPIDRVLARYGSPRVTCIKVDCQGCDLKALEGLQQTIARDRPLIVFEYEHGPSLWHGDTWEDYEAFFREQRYRVTRIREDLGDYVARPV